MDRPSDEYLHEILPKWVPAGKGKRNVSEALQNKEFMSWLVESKFDLAFVHMYHICPLGLAHAANIPWIWLNRYCFNPAIRILSPFIVAQ